MEFGPVQLLVVGFEDGKFSGEILAELRRLREHDIVRLIDLIFVARGEDGEFEAVEHSDLPSEEAEAFGALAGALLGLGAAGEEGAEAGAAGRCRGSRRARLRPRSRRRLVPGG